MAHTIELLLARPGDPRYPDGWKRVRVQWNGDIEELRRGRPGRGRRRWPRQEPLFSLSAEEKRARLADLCQRLELDTGQAAALMEQVLE